MAANWTQDQKKVIELRNRNILVSAAAGSGKTAVLVERIIRMITDPEKPMDVDRLLVVTFTNAAAAEMRERIGQAIDHLLQEHPDDSHLQRQSTLVRHAQITTIDSFCLGILRNHFDSLEIDPAFRIGDEGELLLLKTDVLSELLEDYYQEASPAFMNFVESYASGKADGGLEDIIMQVYRFSQSCPRPDEWLSGCMALGNGPAEFEDTPWMRYLKRDIHIQAQELAAISDRAIALCEEEDGPSLYLPMFLDDRRMIDGLLSAESYEDLNRRLLTIAHAKLSSKKGENEDPDKRKAAFDLRDTIKKALKKMKENYSLEDWEQAREDLKHSFVPVSMLVELAGEFSRRFTEAKKEKNIVDFNDLEHYALEVLVDWEEGAPMPTQAAKLLSESYEEILIDEYQDSNLVQETLLNSISRERDGHPNVFMVGDVKQSIYKFRLARPELFMDKYERYTKEDSLYQKVELHQNFRSRKEVLESVNQVFYRLMGKQLGNIAYTEDAALYPGAVFEETKRPLSYTSKLLLLNTSSEVLGQLDEETADYTARELEAKLAAREIKRLTDPKEGQLIWDKKKNCYRIAEYRDIVILFRSMSGWSDVFVNVLMNEGIPAFAQTQTGYFSALEVQVVLSMLRLIDNPIQDIPLAAVLKSPIVGLKDQELAVLMSRYKGWTKKGQDRGIYGALRHYISLGQEGKRVREEIYKKLLDFWNLLEHFRDLSVYLSLHELIYQVFEETGYYEYISVMPGGAARKANLDMLVEKAVAYEGTSYQGLFHFIRYIDKLQKYDTDFGEASTVGENDNTVRIMSIHKSKGLEFPIVFLPAMGKRFNNQDVTNKILIDPDLGIAADYIDVERRTKTVTLLKKVIKRRILLENLGEELRVLYVAMTRAKELLIMTGADKSLENKLEKWKGQNEGTGLLPFTLLSAASSYLDWMLMSLPGAGNAIAAKEMPVVTLVGEEVVNQAAMGMEKAQLLKLDKSRVYDETWKAAIESRLNDVYPHLAAARLHAKVSVSELKKAGQEVDEEETKVLPTIPRFLSDDEEKLQSAVGNVVWGASRGTAYHRALELLPFGEIRSKEDVAACLDRLVEERKISGETRKLIQVNKLWGFFKTPIAARLSQADREGKLYKEQQFVIGIPASELYPGEVAEDGEELVLIQGIIDAYILEEDGICLVDYKTDRIAEGEEHKLAERYRVQLDYYQRALEQVTGKAVKERFIYSMALQKSIEVP